MITDIPIVFRNVKGSPLTAAEVDKNFENLRSAILALSQQATQRVVIGAEPPAGERNGVLWVPSDYRAIYVWDTANGKWVRLTEIPLYAVAINANNAYEITLSSDIANLNALIGKPVLFKAQGDNTGAATLKVNAFTATPIKKDGATDLAAAQIKSGVIYVVVYDGTNFQIINPTALPPAATATYWVSDRFDVPNVGTTFKLPHSFNKRPEIIRAVLVCVDGPGSGWEQDDEVDSAAFGSDVNNGHEDTPSFTIGCDEEQFIVGLFQADNQVMYVSKTGNMSRLDVSVLRAKFKMKLYAILFP